MVKVARSKQGLVDLVAAGRGDTAFSAMVALKRIWVAGRAKLFAVKLAVAGLRPEAGLSMRMNMVAVVVFEVRCEISCPDYEEVASVNSSLPQVVGNVVCAIALANVFRNAGNALSRLVPMRGGRER